MSRTSRPAIRNGISLILLPQCQDGPGFQLEQWLKKAGLAPEESWTTVVVELDEKRRESLFEDFQRELLFREFATYQKEHRQTIVAYRDDH